MRDLSEYLADETPCGWCSHARGAHYPTDGICTVDYDMPDECTCVGWQEPIL